MRRELVIMICLLGLTGCSMVEVEPKQNEVLSGELDIGMGLSVSPSKLLILDASNLVEVPLVVRNKTETSKELAISFKRAMKLMDGYEHLDLDSGSYLVAHTENFVKLGPTETVSLSLLVKERYTGYVDKEVWLSLWESAGGTVRQELIVRILLKGKKVTR